MIDFSKHLKNPPKEKDPNILTGTLAGWVKNHYTNEVVRRECTWEI
ncbi:hypothetical protein LCGC14_2435340, partial [marine sediment metagenome]